MPQTAFIGARLLLPDQEVREHSLLVDDGIIEGIVPDRDVPSSAEKRDVEGLYLAPGFIDVQVNGGGGALFNDDPTAQTIETIGAAHRAGGTTSFLPTLISDTDDAIHAAQAAVADAVARKSAGVIGLHLEGPFLSKQKQGIHDPGHFRPLSPAMIETFKAFDAGRLLVTLAPETTDTDNIADLDRAGVLVSAGHTAATYEQTVMALNAGLRGFTHLFNAMPPMTSRDPGPVAAALESNAWCSIIADGHHVSDPMLRLVLRAKMDGRVMLITDAMPSVGSGEQAFALGDKKITVRGGRCIDDQGTLAGAHLTMIGAVRHVAEKLHQPLHAAVRMATLEPARFLGLSGQRGSLRPGARADLVAFDAEYGIKACATSEAVDRFTDNFSHRN